MIERKRYLELCQINSINDPCKKILWEGIEYFPQKLVLWFDKNGNVQNTGRMISAVGKSVLEAKLSDLEEIADG